MFRFLGRFVLWIYDTCSGQPSDQEMSLAINKLRDQKKRTDKLYEHKEAEIVRIQEKINSIARLVETRNDKSLRSDEYASLKRYYALRKNASSRLDVLNEQMLAIEDQLSSLETSRSTRETLQTTIIGSRVMRRNNRSMVHHEKIMNEHEKQQDFVNKVQISMSRSSQPIDEYDDEFMGEFTKIVSSSSTSTAHEKENKIKEHRKEISSAKERLANFTSEKIYSQDEPLLQTL